MVRVLHRRSPVSVARLASSEAGLPFRSVLTLASDDGQSTEQSETPAFFRDLNLDQVVASITIGKQEYNLAPFFHQPLKTVEAVEYRQDVMRDLQDPPRLEAVNAFANGLSGVRDHVAQAAKLHYKLQNLAWSLDAIELYGRPSSNCFPLCAPRRLAQPGSAGFLLISTPMSPPPFSSR